MEDLVASRALLLFQFLWHRRHPKTLVTIAFQLVTKRTQFVGKAALVHRSGGHLVLKDLFGSQTGGSAIVAQHRVHDKHMGMQLCILLTAGAVGKCGCDQFAFFKALSLGTGSRKSGFFLNKGKGAFHGAPMGGVNARTHYILGNAPRHTDALGCRKRQIPARPTTFATGIANQGLTMLIKPPAKRNEVFRDDRSSQTQSAGSSTQPLANFTFLGIVFPDFSHGILFHGQEIRGGGVGRARGGDRQHG